jgi:DNA-binding response OmpR family regulator
VTLMRVLLVEDYQPLARALTQGLREAGYAVDATGNGRQGLALAEGNPYDALVLDVMVPEVDGLAILRRVRAAGSNAGVVIITARDQLPDRIAGLDLGADDYLVKPFAMEELVARLHALGRRGRDERDRLVFADLVLELSTRTAQRGGRPVSLTAREAALLELLLRNAQVVVSRERAIEEIWQEAAVPNVVDRYVTRLRRKLGEPPLIHTVRGVGFMLRT